MRPPQKLWQFTVSARPEMPEAIGSQPLLERVVAPELPADQQHGNGDDRSEKAHPFLSAASRGSGS